MRGHLHSLQAANCSRLVVNEDDLKWVTNKKNSVIIKMVP